MGKEAVLSPEEERECVEALRLFGIVNPAHPVLANRGYLAVYLTNLRPDQVQIGGRNPTADEFRYLRKLLTRAGVSRLKELLAAQPWATMPAPDAMASSDTIAVNAADTTGITFHDAVTRDDIMIRDLGINAPVHPHRKRQQSGIEADAIDPEDREDALVYIHRLTNEARYHDALFIVTEYTSLVEPDPEIVEAGCVVIDRAGQYNRLAGAAPVNVLKDCDAIAKAVCKSIPDLFNLPDRGDPELVAKYSLVKRVFKVWMKHCRALIEYKYRTPEGEWLKRPWLDPSEFETVAQVVVAAVRAKLPPRMMETIYRGVKYNARVGLNVIAYEDKQGRFTSEYLRIMAAPCKDVYPEITLEIYKDIARGYLIEGDVTNAEMFLRNIKLNAPHDTDINAMQDELAALRRAGPKKRQVGGFANDWWARQPERGGDAG